MRPVFVALVVLALATPVAGQRAVGADAALAVAREIDRRVATFRAFRSEATNAEWRPVEPWSIRTSEACLASARSLPLAPFATELTPIPTPVRIEGRIGGVAFPKVREGAPLRLACELAVRMPAIAAVLRDHHVDAAVVLSAWRRQPRSSFHTFGLALDLARFVRDDGSVLDVEHDFVRDPDHRTCDGVDRSPSDDHAVALRALACDLADRAELSTVITPEYNEGHHDHFHLDVRPNDGRLFVR